MRAKNHGFTVIEILAAIMIMTILAAIGMQALSSFKGAVTLNASAEDGLSLLLQARAKTLASEGGMQYGVHFETTAVTLFEGTTYDAMDPNNETVTLPNNVIISSISLAGGAVDAVFQRLTGATTESGSVTFQLQSDPAKTRAITIQATGNVSL